jgi:hypothetical protein
MHAYPCYSFVSISTAPAPYKQHWCSTTIFVYLAEFGMAKRRAEYELNPDNWNEEEAPEEAGTFCRAASDVMQHRVMRSGKLKCVDRTENVRINFAIMNTFKM